MNYDHLYLLVFFWCFCLCWCNVVYNYSVITHKSLTFAEICHQHHCHLKEGSFALQQSLYWAESEPVPSWSPPSLQHPNFISTPSLAPYFNPTDGAHIGSTENRGIETVSNNKTLSERWILFLGQKCSIVILHFIKHLLPAVSLIKLIIRYRLSI